MPDSLEIRLRNFTLGGKRFAFKRKRNLAHIVGKAIGVLIPHSSDVFSGNLEKVKSLAMQLMPDLDSELLDIFCSIMPAVVLDAIEHLALDAVAIGTVAHLGGVAFNTFRIVKTLWDEHQVEAVRFPLSSGPDMGILIDSITHLLTEKRKEFKIDLAESTVRAICAGLAPATGCTTAVASALVAFFKTLFYFKRDYDMMNFANSRMAMITTRHQILEEYPLLFPYYLDNATTSDLLGVSFRELITVKRSRELHGIVGKLAILLSKARECIEESRVKLVVCGTEDRDER